MPTGLQQLLLWERTWCHRIRNAGRELDVSTHGDQARRIRRRSRGDVRFHHQHHNLPLRVGRLVRDALLLHEYRRQPPLQDLGYIARALTQRIYRGTRCKRLVGNLAPSRIRRNVGLLVATCALFFASASILAPVTYADYNNPCPGNCSISGSSTATGDCGSSVTISWTVTYDSVLGYTWTWNSNANWPSYCGEPGGCSGQGGAYTIESVGPGSGYGGPSSSPPNVQVGPVWSTGYYDTCSPGGSYLICSYPSGAGCYLPSTSDDYATIEL